MRGLPSPTRMLTGDLPQPTGKPLVCRPGRRRGFALSGTVLAGNAARTALGNPETLLLSVTTQNCRFVITEKCRCPLSAGLVSSVS